MWKECGSDELIQNDHLAISVLRMSGSINRSYGAGSVVAIGLGTQICLWDGNSLLPLLCNPIGERYLASFVSGGVFITPLYSGLSDSFIYNPIVDGICQLSSSINISTDYPIWKVYEKQDDKWYALGSIEGEIDDEDFLLVINNKGDVPSIDNVVPLDFCGLDADKEIIVCSCDLGSKFVGLSSELEKLWEIEFKDSNWSPAKCNPYLHGDSAIVCHEKTIKAVEKYTGKQKWEYSFEVLPTSIKMVEDKIYVSADDLFILDVSTGKELIRKSSGLKLHTAEEYERDERSFIWMHPAEKYIVVTSPLDSFIQLLSPDDLSCMHTIQIPDGYLIKNDSLAFPKIANEKLVVTLFKLNFYDINALMMIDLSRYKPQDQAAFMPMPEIQYRIIPNLKDEHSYSICINTDLVFEATGYAEVLVKELATELRQTKEDDCTVKADWVDKKHNGVINIILDPTGFDEHEINTIEYEIGELSNSLNSKEDTFRVMKLFPTDVPPLKIQPMFLPKSEWDREGEQINIDEFLMERAAY